ncbi:MAG: glycosyltransferase [Desulfovibrio sp.]|uniref:glycosyltransferase n=1 Tax=Desulfovibrio sp. TaxID=885 RepID=UPI0025893A46|nr:glycosyltransferase [Desulfovibrio sp.]MCD7984305.1 glycosyltransferase [Desulfovibrio sp.]
MNIAIACSSLCLSLGGSERVAVNLSTEMAARGHAVTLLSLTHNNKNTIPCYAVSPDVRHVSWENRGKHEDLVQLRKLLVSADIDIFLSMQSGSDHLFWATACMGSGIPFICSERCDPIHYTEQRIWNRSGRLAVLSGADIIHELLPAYISSVPEVFRPKVRIIPNAAPAAMPCNNMAVKGKRLGLLYLARFDQQKRPWLLLEAFRMLAAKHPDWDLLMWGHGPEEKRLKTLIRRWALEDRIQMRGICRNAPFAYAEAQIYCLPSAYEGFPNAVLEAMCAGLPVVGFAECAGVKDVIAHRRTGLVVEESTPAGLAQALDTLMSDASQRHAMGKEGKIAATAYAPAVVYGQWEALFEELARNKGNTVMDSFAREPFASKARLSAVARREWLFRNFGDPMPYTSPWLWQRGSLLCRRLASHFANRMHALLRKTPCKQKDAS